MKHCIAAGLLPCLLVLGGCSRQAPVRLEWPTMGTVAAVQVRGDAANAADFVAACKDVCRRVTDEFNAHDPASRIQSLAALPEGEAMASATPFARPCYEAAFLLTHASGGAFDPRWRGHKTLDFGAIAKGYAVDVMACDAAASATTDDILLDVGGNLKAVRGEWRTGVKDPAGDGVAATVTLRPGEALATSAEYFRGRHIRDGRTGRPVTNDVASVTVLCESAMWADGLSTTLFILGPEKGCSFLCERLGDLHGAGELSVLWIMKDGSRVTFGDDRFD